MVVNFLISKANIKKPKHLAYAGQACPQIKKPLFNAEVLLILKLDNYAFFTFTACNPFLPSSTS